MSLIKRALLTLAALAALFLGVLGLLIPVIPGVLFLLLAAVLFAGASRRFRARLHACARVRPYLRRWEATASLPVLTRARAGVLLLYAAFAHTLDSRRPAPDQI